MVVSERVSYSIVARLHSDAERHFKIKWKQLLSNAPQYHSTLSKKLAERTGMPLLDRCEGGVGGDCNHADKQLRFEKWGQDKIPWLQFQELIANLVNPQNEDIAAWSLGEALDMRENFIACCEDELEAKYIDCNLIVRHERMFTRTVRPSDQQSASESYSEDETCVDN